VVRKKILVDNPADSVVSMSSHFDAGSNKPAQSPLHSGDKRPLRFILAGECWIGEAHSAEAALSTCGSVNVMKALSVFLQDAAASRQVFIAAARNARCVLAVVRWRWTLKVL
jgi:hypothetical protein